MASSFDTIQRLNNNIRELHRNGQLEDILPLWEVLASTMNETQFELAITQLRMSADNKEAARLFLVEGKNAHELQREHGISASRLSKLLKRVSENYEKQLAALDLVSAEYTLDRKTAELVRELEASKISEAKLRSYTSLQANKKNQKNR